MANVGQNAGNWPQHKPATQTDVSIEHYLRLILHRKWLVLATFVVVSGGTMVLSSRLPDLYKSETLILVDPQKVPENYVRSTITGDVRNRLSTLQQQILSATRLQKIIDTLKLYPIERKTLAREDLIARMRKDISVAVVSDFAGAQDLQAFRITYSGREPRLVSQVANELASLFIEENLKAREQQSTGTEEFLKNQLQETKKILETQEHKLADFKLKHIGEMPEQQAVTLQLLGQLQSQLQLEGEALNRAEQQKGLIQSMVVHGSAPVVDLDEAEPKTSSTAAAAAPKPKAPVVNSKKVALEALRARGYTEQHPDVRRLKADIEEEEKKAPEAVEPEPKEVVAAAPIEPKAPAPPVRRAPPVVTANPVLQSQMKTLEAEIAKHKEEMRRLNKLVAGYTAKLESIPVREQQIADLVRDYEISKAHYRGLLEKQLSAETATQLEIRQKGEKFTVLDPAQPAERPYQPNRNMINLGGCAVGLGLGLLLALVTEFLGMSITAPEQITAISGIPVLEVIPVIRTHIDRRILKKRLIWAAVSGLGVTILGSCAVLIYFYRT